MKKILTILSLAIFVLLTPKAYALESTSAKLVSYSGDSRIDDRTKILQKYLEKHNSPLSSHASTFIQTADKYKLDWRLVAAISGVESTFGHAIPYNSYNGWGWGVYGDNVIRFASWDEAIETISKGIRQRYLVNLTDSNPYVIGPTYAASPTWAVRVDYFMQSIESFEVQNAKDQLSISL